MTFAKKVCLSTFISLTPTHCIVNLGPDDGRRFGQTLREMKAQRDLSFDGRYERETQEFHFSRCYFVAVNAVLLSLGIVGDDSQLIPAGFRMLISPPSASAATQTSRWHEQEERETRLLAQEDSFVSPESRKRRRPRRQV